MANKAASLLSVVLLIAFGLEVVSILSVPVSKSITLCNYGDFEFGVFGYCNTKTGDCSSARIGYPTDAGISLPSSARSSLSKLLIVHVVAAGLTLIMFINALLAHVLSSSTGFLLVMLVLALPTFLISLLAFLVDILLFVSHLNWAGWIVLVSTVLIAFSGIILCLMRRTLSSQRAMKKRINDNSELQNLATFNDPNGASTTGFGHFGKEIEFNELKYENSAGDTSDDRIPLKSAITRDDSEYRADMSYDDGADTSLGNMTAGQPANMLAPRQYRGYEPAPAENYTSASPAARSNGLAGSQFRGHDQEFQQPSTNNYGNSSVARSNTPVGSYVPGIEQQRQNYGPNVVPVPRIRAETPPFNATSTPPRNQRRPSGPRALPVPNDARGFSEPTDSGVPTGPIDFSATAYSGATENHAPAVGFAVTSDEALLSPTAVTAVDFSPKAYSSSEIVAPPSQDQTNSRMQLRSHFTEDTPEYSGSQPAEYHPGYSEPQNPARYNRNPDASTYGGLNNSTPATGAGSRDYYSASAPRDNQGVRQDYSSFSTDNFTPPARNYDDNVSVGSSYYSTNQPGSGRGTPMNSSPGHGPGRSPAANRYAQQPPNSTFSSRQPGAPMAGTSVQAAQAIAPAKNLSEGLLDANPDFKIAGAKKRPGAKKMNLPRANDGPYGFS